MRSPANSPGAERTAKECVLSNPDPPQSYTAEHTQGRDVPTPGGLGMILCCRVLMPCFICTRFARLSWESKQKVEWEVWNKV